MNDDNKPGGLRPGSLVTVVGGSGFIGRHTVQALARRGYRVRVAVRRPNNALFLRTMGHLGQVEPVQANIRDERSLRAAIEGADAAVNLVGILYQTGAQTFEGVHAQGVARVAKIAAEAGVKAFVHISAIGADAGSASAYARTKALGEEAVREHMPSAVILRPSIVFGPEDDFFNRFAGLARLSPALPLIGSGMTRFQPVYVKDVADAVARAVETPAMGGNTYEIGGPQVFTFREILEFILKETGRKRALVSIPFWLAKVQAWVLQFAPKPLLTPDQVEQLKHDNVVSEAATAEGRTLAGIGITGTAVEAIVPTYLYRFRRAGQFDRNRGG